MRIRFFILMLSFPILIMANPRATAGIMDLREVNFSKGVTLKLDGKWEFYGNNLLTPGMTDFSGFKPQYVDFDKGWSDINPNDTSIHQFGYGTYRLQLLMPDTVPSMSVILHDMNTAYELYLNGELIERCGKVGTSKAESQPGWQQKTRSLNLQPGDNELVVLVSNFYHHNGGPVTNLSIGTEEKATLKKNFETGSLLFLTGCLVIAGIFSLGLFWFRPSDISGLLFMAFCFLYAYWVLSSDYHFMYSLIDSIAWSTALRLQYISLALAVISYTYFIKLMAEPYIKPWLFHIVTVASVLLIGVVLFSSVPLFTLAIPIYYIFMAAAFILISVLALEEFNFSHKLAWVNIIGIGALMLVIGHKVLALYGITAENPMVNIVGSVVFIFTQALALAIRFGRNYREFSMAALAAARTRDEFLNTMSHELKTPMNAILGMTSFLEKSELDRKQKAKLSAIKRNGESLLSLINDILSISEVGRGRLTLKSQPVNIESCVESAISLSSQHRNKEQVSFKVNIDPKIPSLLRGDSSRIKQILMHLLSNAFKYTPSGEVTLDINLVEEGSDYTNIGFVVEDTGLGISQSQRAWLFEKFKQGQFGNTRRYGGVGLGLSVVNELVSLMGGELKVKSIKNEGTRIYFNLKLKNHVEEPLREVTSIFERNEVDTSLKILHAEDNPVNQKLLEMMLKSLGLKVDLASNGKEALDMAMKKYYNIIFMDIAMPEMDGLEATEKIVANSNSRPIIIAVTANLAEVDKPKCFAAGMNDFLHKPVQQDELKLAIIKWQGLKKYLDDSGEDSIKLSS